MGDVLLVEGRSFVSRMIRSTTKSKWTHSALVVGSLDQLHRKDQDSARKDIQEFYARKVSRISRKSLRHR